MSDSSNHSFDRLSQNYLVSILCEWSKIEQKVHETVITRITQLRTYKLWSLRSPGTPWRLSYFSELWIIEQAPPNFLSLGLNIILFYSIQRKNLKIYFFIFTIKTLYLKSLSSIILSNINGCWIIFVKINICYIRTCVKNVVQVLINWPVNKNLQLFVLNKYINFENIECFEVKSLSQTA